MRQGARAPRQTGQASLEVTLELETEHDLASYAALEGGVSQAEDTTTSAKAWDRNTPGTYRGGKRLVW